MNKQEKTAADLPKPKKLFDIKIECLLPSTVVYRILAEDAEQALQLSKTAAPTSIRPRLAGRRNLKATVLDAGTSIIRLVKNLIGATF